MVRTNTMIKMGDTDAAGVLYFASLFRLAHEAYETWFFDQGLPLSTVLRNRAYSLPIVHAEADYKMPLRLGDAVAISVTVKNLGERSYTLDYSFEGPHGLAATVSTVHVPVNPHDSGNALVVPHEVREILSGN